MNVNLEPRELDVLVGIVSERLSEMREQIYHAETPRFHDQLKEAKEQLSILLDKLRAAERAAA